VLPASFGDRSSISFWTISSILNGKATRQHSPFRRALLSPKNPTFDLNRQSANLVGNSFKIYIEDNTCTHRWAARRKNKRAMLAHVAAAAFSVSSLAAPIRPPEGNCCLQQEPERLSCWPHKSQHGTPIQSR
jgi:hypothetical protein